MIGDIKPAGSGRVYMHWVRQMLSGIHERGEPSVPFLRECGIAPSQLWLPHTSVTAEQYALLFRILMERRQDELLGFLSTPFKYGSFALTCNHALGANTLGQAIRRSGQALKLLQNDFTLSVRRSGGQVAVTFEIHNADTARHVFLHDMLMRVYWQFFAWLVGGHLPVARFDFAHRGAGRPDTYTGVFPGRTCFAQTHSALWMDADWLRAPVRRDKTALRRWLAHAQTNIILPGRIRHPVSTKVRYLLLTAQSGWPNQNAVAQALHMSRATLQRHLRAEGTSFRALKDRLRRDTAMDRLRTSRISLYTLAVELGFSDSTAFQRAFKQWTGQTPGTYRRACTQAASAATHVPVEQQLEDR